MSSAFKSNARMGTGALFQFLFNKIALLFAFWIFFVLEPHQNDTQQSILNDELADSLRTSAKLDNDIAGRRSVEQVRRASAHQPSLKRLLTYHSESVKFLHSAVELVGNKITKNHGLIARDHVTFGTILGISIYPLVFEDT